MALLVPLYEYQCPKCGRFELIRKFSDELLTTCPTCGSEVQKLLSAPAIQFKGTGWYITDYARKSEGKGEGAKGESAKGEGGKSEGAKGEGGEGTKGEGAKTEAKSGGATDSGSSSSGDKKAASSTTGTTTSKDGGSKT